MVEVNEVEDKDFKKKVNQINFRTILINKQILRKFTVVARGEEVKEFSKTIIPIKIKINFRKNLLNNQNLKVNTAEDKEFKKKVNNINIPKILINKKILRKFKVVARWEEVKEFLKTIIPIKIKINLRKNLLNNQNLNNKTIMDEDHEVINQILDKVQKEFINQYQTNLNINKTQTIKPNLTLSIYKIHFNLPPLSNLVVKAHYPLLILLLFVNLLLNNSYKCTINLKTILNKSLR